MTLIFKKQSGSVVGRIITRTIKYELRYAICYIREKNIHLFCGKLCRDEPFYIYCCCSFPTLMTISRSVKSTQEVYVMLLTKSLFCVWSQLIGNVNSTKSGGEALDLLPTISPWLNNNRLAIFTSLIIAVHHLKCFVIGLRSHTDTLKDLNVSFSFSPTLLYLKLVFKISL